MCFEQPLAHYHNYCLSVTCTSTVSSIKSAAEAAFTLTATAMSLYVLIVLGPVELGLVGLGLVAITVQSYDSTPSTTADSETEPHTYTCQRRYC